MTEQELYNQQYQSYMKQIKDGKIRIADIPADLRVKPSASPSS